MYDRSEMNDLADKYPERVNRMKDAYQDWADSCGVISREVILKYQENKNQ